MIKKLLGIENSYLAFKLFCLALVLVLTNIQLEFLNHQYLLNILMEESEPWDRTKFLNPRMKTKF